MGTFIEEKVSPRESTRRPQTTGRGERVMETFFKTLEKMSERIFLTQKLCYTLCEVIEEEEVYGSWDLLLKRGLT